MAAAAATAVATLGGVGSLLSAVPAEAHGPANGQTYGKSRPRPPLLGFTGIPTSTEDRVIVPAGYTAEVLIAWGDPVSDGPEFKDDASNSSYEQAWQWGMNNDGMVYFPFRGSSSHGLLVQNNEYTDDVLLFPDGTANWTAEKTRKSINAHGVSIIEVKKEGRRRPGHWHKWDRRGRCGFKGGEWEVVRPSEYARRVTAATPIRIGGPAAGDARLKTSADPTGKRVLGTLNNCAMGYTPWGTYLACEENFNGYFRKVATPENPLTDMERRYGIGASPVNLWYTTDKRFDTNQEPNEPNRFGWVVEIDPFDPNSTPVKRTALGRFKHEGAWVQEARDGRVVVYSGDDQVNEYIYRYVSRLPWRKARAMGINPLDDGTLYVAKFHAEHGEWLPLTPKNPLLAGWTLNDILINTRAAADLVGATKMDRPEWIDTFPDSLTAIVTLTNNSGRGTGTNPPIDPANPRPSNVYGHIIKWWYRRDWTESTLRLGHLRAGRRSGESRAWLDDRRRQVRLARRHLRRAQRSLVDSDGRIRQHHQLWRVCGLRQQPDALRGHSHRRDASIPHGTEGLRDHWGVRNAGRANYVRRHPASGRSARVARTIPRIRSSTARGRKASRADGRAQPASSSRRTTAESSEAERLPEKRARPASGPPTSSNCMRCWSRSRTRFLTAAISSAATPIFSSAAAPITSADSNVSRT